MIRLKDKNISKNPIARAVAKKQLYSAMLDARIHILMMEEGESAESTLAPIAEGIFVMARAYELMDEMESVDYRKLRSAMLIFVECSENKFTWKHNYAITVNNAIEICVDNWTRVPVKTLQLAIHEVTGKIKEVRR